jgi:hypothetical protein
MGEGGSAGACFGGASAAGARVRDVRLCLVETAADVLYVERRDYLVYVEWPLRCTRGTARRE